jgi:hypothetical protein
MEKTQVVKIVTEDEGRRKHEKLFYKGLIWLNSSVAGPKQGLAQTSVGHNCKSNFPPPSRSGSPAVCR